MRRSTRWTWTLLAAAAAAAGAAATAPSLEAAGGRRTFVCLLDSSSPTGSVWTYEVVGSGILGPGRSVATPDSSDGCANFCESVCWNPARKTLHAVGGAGVSTYAVPAAGTPVVVSGSPTPFSPADSNNGAAACVQRGRKSFVYATRFGAGALDGFGAAAGGTLTPLAAVAASGLSGPSGLAATKDKLIALELNSRTLRSYAVQADGSLKEAPGSPFSPVGTGGLYYVVAHPSGKFVYAGEWTGGSSIYGFSVAKKDGALAPVPGPALVTDLPNVRGGISVAKDGLMFAFQTPSGNGVKDVRALRVQKNGSLAQIGNLQSTGLKDVNVHAFTPDGRYLVVASTASAAVKCFAVDHVTGVLVETDDRPIPNAVTVNGLVVVQP